MQGLTGKKDPVLHRRVPAINSFWNKNLMRETRRGSGCGGDSPGSGKLDQPETHSQDDPVLPQILSWIQAR